MENPQDPPLSDQKRREIEYWNRWQARQSLDEVQAALNLPQEAKPHLTTKKAAFLKMLMREKVYRRMQAATMYEPMPHQEAFHRSQAAERLAIGSNRSGKTNVAAVEVAWAVLGKHPYLKYPTNDGRCVCVAKDQTKIGEVMYRKLFRAGAFDMVRGEDGLFRAWDPPRDGYDRDMRKKALPLIPQREIRKIAWDKKAINCPKMITLKNGWEISFYSSLGKPPNGIDIDLCLAGWTEIYDPVAKQHRRVDQIAEPWHVESWNEKTGRIEIQPAQVPFIKGIGEIVKVTLSNGKTLFTTRKHRILAASGEWVSVQTAFDGHLPLRDASLGQGTFHAVSTHAGSRPETYRKSSPVLSSCAEPEATASRRRSVRESDEPTSDPDCGAECALRETRTNPSYQDDCSPCSRPCGERPRSAEPAARSSPPSRGYAGERSPWRWLGGATEASRANIPACHERSSDTAASHGPCVVSSVAECRILPFNAEVFVIGLESAGSHYIWDFGVSKTHSYVHAGLSNHNCWFDEEIWENEWYTEASARLLDRSGRFIWSATPQAATDQLFSLHEQALDERRTPRPRIEEFTFLLDENPYIAPDDIALFKAKAMADPENYRVRVEGKFLVSSHRVYPEFDKEIHTVPAFKVPENWCRYMVVDPGYTKPAALFFATPPPGTPGDHVYLYDEFYEHQSSARNFAENIYPKTVGVQFEAFIIDAHGSRRTEQNGKTIGQQFAEEFARKGIRSLQTGSHFILIGANQGQFGKGELKAQISQVRSWLWERDGNSPKLQIFQDTCPTVISEMEKYKNKTDKGKPLDEPDSRKWSEGPDAIRYAVLHGCFYVKPRKHKPATPALVKYSQKLKKKRQGDGNYVLLGPMISKEEQ